MRRTFGSDFLTPTTRDDERATLAATTPPIAAAQPQDYLAWRRAALWIAGVLLSLGLLIAMVDHQPFATASVAGNTNAEGEPLRGDELRQAAEQFAQTLGIANVEVIDNLAYLNMTIKGLVAALALLGAMRWTSVMRSRRFARWSWLCAVVVPLCLAAFPWASVLDFTHLDQNLQGGGKAVKVMFGIAFAGQTLITIAPKLLAMFPGIMRAALTIKTLLPEAATPGWLTVVFAPLYAGFMLLPMVVLSQLEGNLMLVLAFALLAAAPASYLLRAKDLTRPHTAAEASTLVHAMRKRAMAFNLGGLALLAAYLVTLDSLPVMTTLHVLLEGLGGVVLTMVVFADVMLALLRFSYEQTRQFRGTPMDQAYDQRWTEFDRCGLSDVKQALGVGEFGDLRARAQQAARREEPPQPPPPSPADREPPPPHEPTEPPPLPPAR